MDKHELKNRLKQLAIKTARLCMKLPQTIVNRAYIGQVIGSSSSAASNYRAACGGKSKVDLIDNLPQNNETKNASTVVSIGDDAAVIDHFGKKTVLTTDMLVEEIHFDLMYTPLKHLGYKSIIVNLSDIYAMNATATQATI